MFTNSIEKLKALQLSGFKAVRSLSLDTDHSKHETLSIRSDKAITEKLFVSLFYFVCRMLYVHTTYSKDKVINVIAFMAFQDVLLESLFMVEAYRNFTFSFDSL